MKQQQLADSVDPVAAAHVTLSPTTRVVTSTSSVTTVPFAVVEATNTTTTTSATNTAAVASTPVAAVPPVATPEPTCTTQISSPLPPPENKSSGSTNSPTATTATASPTTTPGKPITSPSVASSKRKSSTPSLNHHHQQPPHPALDLYNPKQSTRCTIHRPTLAELQSHTFSDYVRKFVLPAASVRYETPESSLPEGDPHAPPNASSSSTTPAATTPVVLPVLQTLSHPMILREGMAKICLPDGFEHHPMVTDRSGRGPDWQDGRLSQVELASPIRQQLHGIAGVYEYLLMDSPTITLGALRTAADAYRLQQVGCAVEEELWNVQDEEEENTTTTATTSSSNNASAVEKKDGNDDDDAQTPTETSVPDRSTKVQPPNTATTKKVLSDERLEALERLFWKRLGPTMPPPLYGADQPGSLFRPDDPASGWSLAQLDSCLHVLPNIPGVTSSYLYAGMWATVFCAHTEDMNLLSINFLHAGQPKFWYAVAQPDAARFLTVAQFQFAPQAAQCHEFLRHKRYLLSPAVLKKAGIRYQTAVQYPGEAIITFPASYHFGFNLGFNVAEATNFGVPEWLPFGRQAKICLCRPHSVRIDMDRLEALLQRYEQDQKGLRRGNRLTWKEWSRRREKRKEEKRKEEDEEENGGGGAAADKVSTAVAPLVGAGQLHEKGKRSKKTTLSEQQRKNEFWVEVMKPIASNGRVGDSDKKQKTRSKSAVSKKRQIVKEVEEIWHLAKPVGRKGLELKTKVLFMVPGTTLWAMCQKRQIGTGDDSDDDYDDSDEEEQCFAGQVVEIADDHVRIHIDGLKKSEDIWMPASSPKLFLDGGKWTDEQQADMPVLHYWQEMDSKRRCVDNK